jgi:hypothetical protein
MFSSYVCVHKGYRTARNQEIKHSKTECHPDLKICIDPPSFPPIIVNTQEKIKIVFFFIKNEFALNTVPVIFDKFFLTFSSAKKKAYICLN